MEQATGADTAVGAVEARELVQQAGTYVYRLLRENLPDEILFHDYKHTVDVHNDTVKIARGEGLDKHERALLELAAWFHDTGFTETYDGHEEASARLAEAYLTDRGLPAEEVERVKALILATHPEHVPQDLGEKIIRDADVAHAGKRKKFFRYSERLRHEREHHEGKTYTDREWTEIQLRFLTGVRYNTEFASSEYGGRRRRNLKEVRRTLAEMMDKEREVEVPKKEEGDPKRGKETLFRTAYRNHINLSAIADSKANIMISINAILMSIIISYVSSRIQTDPWLTVPATTLLLTSLVAVVFAILSARPKVTSKVFTVEDVRRDRANILFFGNFVNMSGDDFRVGIREIMEDYDRLYNSMINDLHSLGKVLKKKYHLLWISYTVFMAGLTLSVLLFLAFFIWMP